MCVTLKNSYVEILTSQCDGFRRWGLWKVRRMQPFQNEISAFVRRDTQKISLPPLFLLRSCEVRRRWAPANQEECSHQNPIMLAPWSQTPQPPSFQK